MGRTLKDSKKDARNFRASFLLYLTVQRLAVTFILFLFDKHIFAALEWLLCLTIGKRIAVLR